MLFPKISRTEVSSCRELEGGGEGVGGVSRDFSCISPKGVDFGA